MGISITVSAIILAKASEVSYSGNINANNVQDAIEYLYNSYSSTLVLNANERLIGKEATITIASYEQKITLKETNKIKVDKLGTYTITIDGTRKTVEVLEYGKSYDVNINQTVVYENGSWGEGFSKSIVSYWTSSTTPTITYGNEYINFHVGSAEDSNIGFKLDLTNYTKAFVTLQYTTSAQIYSGIFTNNSLNGIFHINHVSNGQTTDGTTNKQTVELDISNITGSTYLGVFNGTYSNVIKSVKIYSIILQK